MADKHGELDVTRGGSGGWKLHELSEDLIINPTTSFFSVNTTFMRSTASAALRGSDCDNLMSQDKMRDHRGTMLLR
jgi:hypothetical protein